MAAETRSLTLNHKVKWGGFNLKRIINSMFKGIKEKVLFFIKIFSLKAGTFK